MRPSFVALVASALLAACSPAAQDSGANASGPDAKGDAVASSGQHLPKVPVVITRANGGPPVKLSIEIALGRQEQEEGLMHRTDLSPGDGMLFPMIPARMPNFWMKDTPTPLDLLFIAMDGTVVHLVAGAKPNDRTPLFAEQPVAGVLELRGGDAARLGIAEGDSVNWGTCASEAEPEPSAEMDNFCPA